MIAVLSASVNRAFWDIRDRIENYNRTTCRGKFGDGNEFFIAVSEDQLKGQRINAYECYGDVPQRMIDFARASVR